MTSIIKKCNQHSWLYPVVLPLTFIGLWGCADSPEAKLELAVRPSTQILVKQRVEFDATGSSYDRISWKLDGAFYGPCQTRKKCALIFDEPGLHEVLVSVALESTPDWSGFSSQTESYDEQLVKLTVLQE
ncbi:hypothetical protein WDW89_16265 [Deltaproteobacteria bacterium TL4]